MYIVYLQIIDLICIKCIRENQGMIQVSPSTKRSNKYNPMLNDTKIKKILTRELIFQHHFYICSYVY